jgi:hypothetical protein
MKKTPKTPKGLTKGVTLKKLSQLNGTPDPDLEDTEPILWRPAPKKGKSTGHGGTRPGSGRPRDPEAHLKEQVTIVLRKDTTAALREVAQSKFFGELLQWHLDTHPLPTREEYCKHRYDRAESAREWREE